MNTPFLVGIIAVILLSSKPLPSHFVNGAPLADTTLGVNEVVWIGPEDMGTYVGSPSIVELPPSRNAKYNYNSSVLLASHDTFGPGVADANQVFVYKSVDGGVNWEYISTISNQYWSTFFVQPSSGDVFIIGTSAAGGNITIQRSHDQGQTWTEYTTISGYISGKMFSTGPTPVLNAFGKFYRAFEYNNASWGSGYETVIVSADETANLTDPNICSVIGIVPFAESAVPADWNPVPNIVIPSYGWLEGNAVASPNGTLYDMLRVNSYPTANKAALVSYGVNGSQWDTPRFERFIDFPGGGSKFTVRRDNVTGLYVALTSPGVDNNITMLPSCALGGATENGTFPSITFPAPFCGIADLMAPCSPHCVWVHSVQRNILSMVVSKDLVTWSTWATLLQDDTGNVDWVSQMYTGFQYVDWQFSGDDIIYLVRAGYRGAASAHNANRLLFKVLKDWRTVGPTKGGR
eukprot:TRINITY_DN4564_c0_g1_i1.p1 TRINITY_DN4564_c0_g1~~TRINITY_DN4564_c0_g1_i1.p1  ORF type:complete len:462 (+),score=70.36 TRINITY_DN4564_c0_g1_i1:161-1546(+)